MVEDKIACLSKYILTEHNFDKNLQIVNPIKYPEYKKKEYKEKEIEKKDKLFWSVYDILFSKIEDQLITNKSKLEKDIKISLIEKIKCKGVKFEIVENNLLNDSFLLLESLHLICIYYKTRICIYNDEMIICLGKDGPVHYINNYIITERPEKELYEIENVYKPLKSVSGYKLDDLKKIAIKLNIEISTKQKMYDCIIDKINLFMNNK